MKIDAPIGKAEPASRVNRVKPQKHRQPGRRQCLRRKKLDRHGFHHRGFLRMAIVGAWSRHYYDSLALLLNCGRFKQHYSLLLDGSALPIIDRSHLSLALLWFSFVFNN